MSKKQPQQEKEGGQPQNSKVAPGEAGGRGGHMKSRFPLKGGLSCQLFDGALHCLPCALEPSTNLASCEDHATFFLLVERESGVLLTPVTEQTPEHFIWHMEGTECQRVFYCT